MPDERPQQNSADHDLLIRLDTKFDGLADKFDALSENVVGRVDNLEKDAVKTRADVKDVRDDFSSFKDGEFKEVKTDVRFMNRYMWMALGALSLLQMYLFYRQVFPRP